MGAYDFIWDDEAVFCEECGEATDELFESRDLKHVCEGCLNGVDEDFAREMWDEEEAGPIRPNDGSERYDN